MRVVGIKQLLAGGAIVATSDPKDLRRLASHATRVAVVEIG